MNGLICSVMTAVFLSGCSYTPLHEGSIHRMDLWAIEYGTRTPAGYNIGEFLEMKESHTYKGTITDHAFLKRLDDLLEVPRDSSGGYFGGTRIVCVLYRPGSVYDTLAFGGYSMYYKGAKCDVDSNLLRAVGERLPSIHKDFIEYFIVENLRGSRP